MNTKRSTIRCPIHGSISVSQSELRLIDNPYFQRLRQISQLGFASYVFPGAVHTRFSHSIGAMHLAGQVFDLLTQNCSSILLRHYTAKQLSYFRKILRYAALLHDIGHPPFSHAAESLLPPLSCLEIPKTASTVENRQSTHEDFSQMIIRHLALDKRLLSEEEATDVIGILSKNQELSENMNSNTGTPMIFPLLCQLINGEIDVDRMDYLLRDSYFAGVPYGRFDLDRLINSFLCCVEKNLGQFLLAIDHEGVPSYEDFLLARIHMFYQIYFHKSLGAYRFYLQKAINEKEIDFEIDGSSQNFLFSTETALMEEFKRKRDKKWSGKIYNRIPAKNLIRVIDGDKTRLAKMEEIKTVLSQNGIEVIESYSYNQYSSQIRGEIPNRGTVLVVDRELEQEVIVPLSEKSSLLINRERKIEIFQLYVSREEYDRSIQLIQGVL